MDVHQSGRPSETVTSEGIPAQSGRPSELIAPVRRVADGQKIGSHDCARSVSSRLPSGAPTSSACHSGSSGKLRCTSRSFPTSSRASCRGGERSSGGGVGGRACRRARARRLSTTTSGEVCDRGRGGITSENESLSSLSDEQALCTLSRLPWLGWVGSRASRWAGLGGRSPPFTLPPLRYGDPAR